MEICQCFDFIRNSLRILWGFFEDSLGKTILFKKHCIALCTMHSFRHRLVGRQSWFPAPASWFLNKIEFYQNLKPNSYYTTIICILISKRKWNFNLEFQVLISSLNFKFEFQVWISSSNFKFEFQVWFSILNFKFEFQIWISNLNFKVEFQARIPSLNFKSLKTMFPQPVHVDF